MGSGLILLVIVGAWLAVLVPMALRSHDTGVAARSADRFHDAVRVLSRRGPRSGPAEPSPQRQERSDPPDRQLDRPDRAPVPVAVRRRRILLGLVASGLLGLLGGLVARPLLLVGLVLLGLAALYAGLLRRLELARRARAEWEAWESWQVQDDDWQGPAVAGMPGPEATMSVPVRREPVLYDEAAFAALDTGPPPVVAQDDDDTWSPVPVPPPTYVTAPRVDPPASAWSGHGITAAELGEAEDEALDDILQRRRAVGDW